MYGDKLLPHDSDAEEAVIGSLLIDDEAISKIARLLSPDDFYHEKNRLAYEACLALNERNEPINQITLAHELAQREKLEAIGGTAYLSHLISRVPTSVHIEYYAQLVHRMAMMRRLIDVAGQIATIGYEAGPDVDVALDRAEEALFRLRRGERRRDFIHIRGVLDQYFELDEYIGEGGLALRPIEGEISFVKTGFVMLDNILGGLQRSDMIVLGARPSLGKTSLALSIARNAAVDQGARVAIFSLEMAKEQVVQRLLAGESGVDTNRVRLWQLSELPQVEERRVMDATGVLSEAPIYIDDSPVLGIVEMRNKARRLYNERGIDLIIIDFLQLMRADGRYQNPVQEMSEISRSVKGLARELHVPVLALSQLSRAVELRSPHIPMLSDLRESGSIEQDADVVMFIYREDVYTSKEEWERRYPDKDYPEGIADIHIAKHRNGPTGKRSLLFQQRITKFVNLESGRT